MFEALSYIVKDMDPDGIELYFTISPQTARDKHTTKLVQLLDKKKLDGMTDISLRLKTLLDKYFVDNSQHYSSGANFLRNIRSARQSRPLNVYILTNGLWETDPDVESVLRRVTQKLLELNLPKSQIGLQFITFGENPVALRRLHHLDSHIEEGLWVLHNSFPNTLSNLRDNDSNM